MGSNCTLKLSRLSLAILPCTDMLHGVQGYCHSYSNANRAVFHGLSARCLRLYVAAGRATSASCRAFRSSDASYTRLPHYEECRPYNTVVRWCGPVDHEALGMVLY